MKLKGRWKEAEVAVNALCEATCKCDADGITLYFFSSHSKTTKGECPYFRKYENIASGADVMKQFANADNAPHGGTDLTAVLEDALPSGRGTYAYSYMHICIYTYTHKRRAHIHTYIHTYMHILIHTYTYT